MEKKKRKVPVGLIALLVGLMVVGGWFYYQEVIVPSKYVVEDIDVPIETCVIYTYGWEDTHRNHIENVANALEASEAKFFFIECDGGNGSYFNSVTQTDKSTYEESVPLTADEAFQVFGSNMTAFLNTDYSKIPDDKRVFYNGKYDSGAGCLFGDQGPMSAVMWSEDDPYENSIDEFFGTDIYQYFLDHELNISCDNVEMTKLGGQAYLAEYASSYQVQGSEPIREQMLYVFVGYADVTTENATGDLSDMGIFGNPGETVKVKIVATGSNFGLYQCYLERVE